MSTDVEDEASGAVEAADRETRGSLVRSLLAVVANVGVLTALLVYFGWVRSDQMAKMLGIDEAILGMTVDDYVRRSVQPVVLLPICAAIAGLAWVGLDQWLRRRRIRFGSDDRIVTWVARWMWLIAVGVLMLGLVLGLIGYAITYIAAPLVCAGGMLLLLYGLMLRGGLRDAVRFAPMTEGVLRGAIAILVAIGLFWSAMNYATVEGTELARDFPNQIEKLPGVMVDSAAPLDIVSPGVDVTCAGSGEDLRYRYRGLRLLESTGGNYFLISDEWTFDYGVVVMLPVDGDGLRFTFVRDVYGIADAGGFGPCASGGSEAEVAGQG
ncbi:hypothetical protein [Microbacterium trichothecenolyticum]|uniref:Uncharacterized protein n=1 Tax=Microbacterium trichothecenolyticum TaxID=69370 RepID=A0A0M2H2W5_MICTR|nr:hypothetical protein [Microbacterium trichothecenolyticum]KJL40613.1 hypothetical protein RS82_03229 [Microbacterium trichothecenolyticum]